MSKRSCQRERPNVLCPCSRLSCVDCFTASSVSAPKRSVQSKGENIETNSYTGSIGTEYWNCQENQGMNDDRKQKSRGVLQLSTEKHEERAESGRVAASKRKKDNNNELQWFDYEVQQKYLRENKRIMSYQRSIRMN